jgi:hypothetical protein
MTSGGQSSTGWGLGGQVNLSERHHLLFSTSRQVTGETGSMVYLGYQFTAGPFGDLRSWFGRGHPAS